MEFVWIAVMPDEALRRRNGGSQQGTLILKLSAKLLFSCTQELHSKAYFIFQRRG